MLTSSETSSVPNNSTSVVIVRFVICNFITHASVAGAGQEIVTVAFNFTTYTIRVAYQIAFVKILVQ